MGNTEIKEVSRRKVMKGAAWSIPAIGAAVAVPLASASSTNPVGAWKLDVTPQCGTFWGWTSGLGFRIQNTGSAPIPAGTTFTWEIQEGVWTDYVLGLLGTPTKLPNPVMEAFYKKYVDAGNPPFAFWHEDHGIGITASHPGDPGQNSWDAWYRGEDEIAAPQQDLAMRDGYWSYRKKHVTFTVPAGGFPPGAETSFGFRTNVLWPNFKAFMTLISGDTNGGQGNAGAKPAWISCETQVLRPTK